MSVLDARMISRGAAVTACGVSLLLAVGASDIAAQRTRTAPAAAPPRVDSAAWQSLKWRHVGPEGNRVTSVTGVPGDRATYYAGAAPGGVWKTSDGGNRWTTLFDNKPGEPLAGVVDVSLISP